MSDLWIGTAVIPTIDAAGEKLSALQAKRFLEEMARFEGVPLTIEMHSNRWAHRDDTYREFAGLRLHVSPNLPLNEIWALSPSGIPAAVIVNLCSPE